MSRKTRTFVVIASAVLVATMAVALPPIFDDEQKTDEPNSASRASSVTYAEDAGTSTSTSSADDSTSTVPPETNDEADTPTPTTEKGEEGNGSTTTTTTAAASPTTAAASPTTAPTTIAGAAPPPKAEPSVGVSASQTITGDACPCTVTGLSELQGDVRLSGDLIVDGGTLVARSGVNLDGNGFQIVFVNGGQADFQGTPVAAWTGKGENANLTRDLSFTNLQRIMFTDQAGPSTLKFFTVTDSGSPTLGDYPLHWHLNGDSTRGTIVEGVVVLNGQHHAFVPHGSHGITFKDTIAKNTKGPAYWWDKAFTNPTTCENDNDGRCSADDSNDVTYDHALADGVTNAPGDDRGYRLSAFDLGAGIGDIVRNSVAINVHPSHPLDCSGFQWPEGGNSRTSEPWVFENNYGESDCHGIFVWQNNTDGHVIDGFTGGGVSHGAYSNTYLYQNIDVPRVEIHAVDWAITDSVLGDVITLQHQFEGTVQITNSTLTSFTLNDNGIQPAVYILDNVNITCSEILSLDAHPDSKVIIDDIQC